MYDDDKVSKSAIANDRYRLIEFAARETSKDQTAITVQSQGSYAGAPDAIKMKMRVNGCAKAPRQVLANGRKVKHAFKENCVIFDVNFNPGSILTITIDK